MTIKKPKPRKNIGTLLIMFGVLSIAIASWQIVPLILVPSLFFALYWIYLIAFTFVLMVGIMLIIIGVRFIEVEPQQKR